MFEYDATGIEPSAGGYTVAPDGVYTLQIINATDEKDGMKRINKNGDPYVNVESQIDGGDYAGCRVWNNVTFAKPGSRGAGISIAFLKAIGEPFEGKIAIDPSKWILKKYQAKLIVETDNKGRPKNEIAYFVFDDKDTDEVPF